MALALPGAHAGEHMGHGDLRVENKSFASLPADSTIVSIKIDPVALDALVQSDPATFRNVWGGRWVGVKLATVDAKTVEELLADAWRLTAPARLRNSAAGGEVATAPATPPRKRRAATTAGARAPTSKK